MQRAISTMRITIAAMASVVMLIAITPINLAGNDHVPADHASMPHDGCPPMC